MKKTALFCVLSLVLSSTSWAESYRGRNADDGRESCLVDVVRNSKGDVSKLSIWMADSYNCIEASLLPSGVKGTKASVSGFSTKTITNERMIDRDQDEFSTNILTLKIRLKQNKEGELIAAQAGIWRYYKSLPWSFPQKYWNKNADCVDLIREN